MQKLSRRYLTVVCTQRVTRVKTQCRYTFISKSFFVCLHVKICETHTLEPIRLIPVNSRMYRVMSYAFPHFHLGFYITLSHFNVRPVHWIFPGSDATAPIPRDFTNATYTYSCKTRKLFTASVIASSLSPHGGSISTFFVLHKYFIENSSKCSNDNFNIGTFTRRNKVY